MAKKKKGVETDKMDKTDKTGLTAREITTHQCGAGMDEAVKVLVLEPLKFYRKPALQAMRPYVPGEDLTGVSVNKEDTPELGGMIAVNADNPDDQWYVGKAFFEKNYEPADPIAIEDHVPRIDRDHVREIMTHKCGAGMDEAVQVFALDAPGPGNACHQYAVGAPGEQGVMNGPMIHFQEGAVAEAGPNGISCEALLAVVIDRLEGFQSGPYPCEENAAALDHCRRALRNLQKLTIERAQRGVEGVSKK